MEKDFYNDEFDSFLQQKADEYLMYPSESAWKKIRTQLFWRRNWLSVAGSILFLCLLFFIPESFFNTIFDSHSPAGQPAQGGHDMSGTSSSAAAPATRPSNPLRSIPGTQKAQPTGSVNDIGTPGPSGQVGFSPTQQSASGFHPTALSLHNHSADSRSQASLRIVKASAMLQSPASTHDIDISSHFTTTVPVEKETVKAIVIPEETPIQDLPEATTGTVNWLEDKALIRLTPKNNSRFNLQFYFSPLVSYRTLTDNDLLSHNRPSNAPLSPTPVSVNQYVDHQPSIGVELGSNLLYRATKRLTFKSGLQLNYSRYTIKAYKVGYEKASIALKSYGWSDTLTSYTTIRNFNGYLQEQLQNQYLQVSVPLGAEFKVLGNKKFQFNIAGTVQPTLLLFNDTYLLSTDYINYTKEPSLVRHWNLHTSAEAYISYQFATVRWQVGPQFRYQLLSSYNDRYPIREYLMEYGIKFGISKTLR